MNRSEKGFMSMRRKYLTAVTIALLLLAVAIVYACPDRDFLWNSSLRVSMNDGMAQHHPCSDTRTDTCQSVRNRMLSVEASAFQMHAPQHGFTEMLQVLLQPHVETDLFHGSSLLTATFHPVFKLQFPFSYLVLRL
jgi:hypothetical protein